MFTKITNHKNIVSSNWEQKGSWIMCFMRKIQWKITTALLSTWIFLSSPIKDTLNAAIINDKNFKSAEISDFYNQPKIINQILPSWEEVMIDLKKMESWEFSDLQTNLLNNKTWKQVDVKWIWPEEFVKNKFWEWDWHYLVNENWNIIKGDKSLFFWKYYTLCKNKNEARLIGEKIKQIKWELNFDITPKKPIALEKNIQQTQLSSDQFFKKISDLKLNPKTNIEIQNIFKKANYDWVSSLNHIKMIAHVETRWWIFLDYLEKAKKLKSALSQRKYIDLAVKSLFWKNGDQWFFQITHLWLKNETKNNWIDFWNKIIKNNELLKKTLYNTFVYAVDNNLTSDQIFKKLEEIDVRFNIEQMVPLITKSFVRIHSNLENISNISSEDKVKLTIMAYNRWEPWAYKTANNISKMWINLDKYLKKYWISKRDLNKRLSYVESTKRWIISESKQSKLSIISHPAEKWTHLKLCSRTAWKNLSKLVSSQEKILRWNAKDLIKKLSKTNSLLDWNSLVKAIHSSDRNVFDIYIKTRNWHRSVFFKENNKIYVLDPYRTNTKSPVLLENYKPFQSWAKFILWPSYSSNLINKNIQSASILNEFEKREISVAYNENVYEIPKTTISNTQNKTKENINITIGNKKIGEIKKKTKVSSKYITARAKLWKTPNNIIASLDKNIIYYKARWQIKTVWKLELIKNKEQLNLCENYIDHLYRKGVTWDFEAYKLSKKYEEAKVSIMNNIIKLENKLNINYAKVEEKKAA